MLLEPTSSFSSTPRSTSSDADLSASPAFYVLIGWLQMLVARGGETGVEGPVSGKVRSPYSKALESFLWLINFQNAFRRKAYATCQSNDANGVEATGKADAQPTPRTFADQVGIPIATEILINFGGLSAATAAALSYKCEDQLTQSGNATPEPEDIQSIEQSMHTEGVKIARECIIKTCWFLSCGLVALREVINNFKYEHDRKVKERLAKAVKGKTLHALLRAVVAGRSDSNVPDDEDVLHRFMGFHVDPTSHPAGQESQSGSARHGRCKRNEELINKFPCKHAESLEGNRCLLHIAFGKRENPTTGESIEVTTREQESRFRDDESQATSESEDDDHQAAAVSGKRKASSMSSQSTTVKALRLELPSTPPCSAESPGGHEPISIDSAEERDRAIAAYYGLIAYAAGADNTGFLLPHMGQSHATIKNLEDTFPPRYQASLLAQAASVLAEHSFTQGQSSRVASDAMAWISDLKLFPGRAEGASTLVDVVQALDTLSVSCSGSGPAQVCQRSRSGLPPQLDINKTTGAVAMDFIYSLNR